MTIQLNSVAKYRYAKDVAIRKSQASTAAVSTTMSQMILHSNNPSSRSSIDVSSLNVPKKRKDQSPSKVHCSG